MKTLKLKTFSVNAPVDTNHFFILSKGYNAGKPLEKPCPNCFIVTAENQQDKYELYWICYSLWKCGAYLPFLCGSVVPFLHIRDAEREIEKALRNIRDTNGQLDQNVNQLQELIRKEKMLNLQLKLIDGMKALISSKLVGMQKLK